MKHYSVEHTEVIRKWITLYNEEDLKNAKESASQTIDSLIDELNGLKKDIETISIDDDNIKILWKSVDCLYERPCDEYDEPRGLCMDAVNSINRVILIAENMCDQLEYADSIEEHANRFNVIL